jgi:hypothetical protein
VLATPTHLDWLIIGCEVGFWLVLMGALMARYLLRQERHSKALLLVLPALDLWLFVVTVVDLRGGTLATFAHGLAAAYIGFTVAFGSIAVAWADQRFAHLFAGGPKPRGAPQHRWLAVRAELGFWIRCIAAAAITMLLLIGMIVMFNNDPRTEALRDWFRIAAGSIIFWFVFGPVWTMLFYKRSPSHALRKKPDEMQSFAVLDFPAVISPSMWRPLWATA